MIEKQKRGRKPQDKVSRGYTFNASVAQYIDALPEGERSRFANSLLHQGIDSEELSKKKFYTYLLMRPDGTVFYVGKGKGYRIDDHERDARNGIESHKCRVIRKIWEQGGQVIKERVAFFDEEEDAYALEILLIAFFGRENLTNSTDGGEGGSGRPSQDKVMRPYTLDRVLVEFLDSLPDGERSSFMNDAAIESKQFQQSPQFEQWKQSPAYERWLKRHS
jgi:hypothetical protein